MVGIRKRYTRSGLLKALYAGVSAGVMGGAAMAQVSSPEPPLKLRTDYLGYAASVSGRLGFTDNQNLRRDGLKDSEYYVSVMTSGGVIISSPRVTGLIIGDLDVSYLVDDSDVAVNQNIGATSTFTAVDNWLYADVSGSTSRQLLGDNARFSSNANAARGQRVNVHSYSLSPYVYHQGPDQSSVELRYRFSQSFVDDNNNFGGLNSGFVNDSITNEALASYESGATFDKLRLRLSAYGNDTNEDSRDFFVALPGGGFDMVSGFDYQQGSLLGEVQFALSSTFALSGAVGYDEVDTDGAAALFFDDDELSGTFWRAGFSAQPGPRSTVRLEYGERYGDDFIDADMSYQISQRFRFSAGATRQFRTRTQSLSANFRSTQRGVLEFADKLREGAEMSPRGVIDAANFAQSGLGGGGAQTSGVAVSDSAYAQLAGVFSRTNIAARGYYNDDDFGFRQIETFGAGLSVRRNLSRRMSAYGSANWRHADTTIDIASCLATPGFFGFDPTDPLFDANVECASLTGETGETDTLIFRVGAAYQLVKNASVFGEYSHSQRFADNPLQEYGENFVLVGITLDFK